MGNPTIDGERDPCSLMLLYVPGSNIPNKANRSVTQLRIGKWHTRVYRGSVGMLVICLFDQITHKLCPSLYLILSVSVALSFSLDLGALITSQVCGSTTFSSASIGTIHTGPKWLGNEGLSEWVSGLFRLIRTLLVCNSLDDWTAYKTTKETVEEEPSPETVISAHSLFCYVNEDDDELCSNTLGLNRMTLAQSTTTTGLTTTRLVMEDDDREITLCRYY